MDIFLIKTSTSDNIPAEILEEFCHKKFKDLNKKNVHALAYLMLDRILKEVYQIQEREIEFINKKPVLKTQKKHFSVSHSEDYVALAFSDFNCGIDIEKIKLRDYKKIAERMNFSSDNLTDFYYDWTKFEAEYKLSDKSVCQKYYQVENYLVCAVSINPQEKFQIYFSV